MRNFRQIIEPKLKPCFHCNTIVLLVTEVGFEKGVDEGYRVSCTCGYAARRIHKWYANRQKLIDDWNNHIIDVEI